LTHKFFTKLLALFVLLLLFHTMVMELVFHLMEAETKGRTLQLLGREALWSGLIALGVALPLAAWVAGRLSVRLQSVVAFARRIADGDLTARLEHPEKDELSPMETALNQTAERLGRNFAELESRRQELAAMLDSMQEAVVALTPEGFVRARRFTRAGHWCTLCAILNCWLACAARLNGAKSALGAPVRWLLAACLK
jgi:two-component system phosphate regulon sensor histidine kinase PhoR